MLSRGFDSDWIVAAPKTVREPAERAEWSVEFSPKEDGWGSGPRRAREITFEMLLPKFVWVHKSTGDIRVMTVSQQRKE